MHNYSFNLNSLNLSSAVIIEHSSIMSLHPDRLGTNIFFHHISMLAVLNRLSINKDLFSTVLTLPRWVLSRTEATHWLDNWLT